MNYLYKLIRQNQINEIFQQKEEPSIEIGALTTYDPETTIRLIDLLAKQLNKLLTLDRMAYGQPTKYSQRILADLPPTYEEFGHLFNIKIKESDFINYRIFTQLRKDKGGVLSEKQRQDYLMKYEYCPEDYVKLLCEEGYEHTLIFFFHKWANLKQQLPLKKMESHIFCCAATGTGKSTLLVALLWRMISHSKEYGFVIIDPHGEMSKQIKAFNLHKTQKNRFIYFDPEFKEGFTPCLNPFELDSKKDKDVNFQAEQITSIFINALESDGSANKLSTLMISLLDKCTYFLLERGNSSIVDLLRLLNGDIDIFKEAQSFDSYFDEEFLKPSNKTRKGLKGRVEWFLNSPILRKVLSGKSTFSFSDALKSGKIILFNLSQMGEFTQSILGKIIITRTRAICRTREKGAIENKRIFILIDECQVFVGKNYSKILSEMRGYGLSAILSCQFPQQLENELNGVTKNCAIKIAASDDLDDVNEVIKLPKNASLSDWEFFIKVRNQKVSKFKSPDFLFTDEDIFLSKKDQKALDNYLLQKYYRKIKKKETKLNNPNLSANERKENSLQPPFNLQIPEEND